MERAAVVFYEPDDQVWVASGTFVRFGGRDWILTAKHVIQSVVERPNARCAWAPNGGSVRDYLDKAFLEVAEAVEGALDADLGVVLLRAGEIPTGLTIADEQIDTADAPVPNDDVIYMMGTASVLRGLVRAQHDLPEAQTVALFGTHVKNKCSAAPHTVEPPGKPRAATLDYHVDWSRAAMNGGQYRDLFVAGGMSGAAVWSVSLPMKDDPRVWSPERARLIAVAWYHDVENNCVRAVPAGRFRRAAFDVLHGGGHRFSKQA